MAGRGSIRVQSCPECPLGGAGYLLRDSEGHLVLGLSVEVAAVGFGGSASPLLEEECDAGVAALVAEVSDPLLLHRAGAGAALASGD